MKIGVFTVLFGAKPLEEALDYIVEAGCEAVEIGCGNYPGVAHCDPDILLKNDSKIKEFKKAIDSRNLIISALSCHGNPLHPNKEIAQSHKKQHRKAILLAEKLGVSRIIGFSGCPGDSEKAKYPNWVTCPWPTDFLKILDWQWKEKVIPYWKEEAAYAKKHGVQMICLEMHPGFVVYNPETLLKLRNAVGNIIGANFDPSHLFWQGIDPVLAIRNLKGAIYHFHAKDTRLDAANIKINGVLDTKHFSNIEKRSWVFRTVGYGHSETVWKDIVSELSVSGYDYVLSIEHEDGLMSINEGFKKAVTFLKNVTIKEKPSAMWWA
ncbi:MAG: sugar phosphate isomerase/epimerase [Candidatus Firestonebacteria bacterium]